MALGVVAQGLKMAYALYCIGDCLFVINAPGIEADFQRKPLGDDVFQHCFKIRNINGDIGKKQSALINEAFAKKADISRGTYKVKQLNGLDDIDFLVANKDKIVAWENASR